MKTFWMAAVSGKGAPTKRHDTHQAALSEAMRLAELLDAEAVVLRAEKAVRPVGRVVVEQLEARA